MEQQRQNKRRAPTEQMIGETDKRRNDIYT